MDLTSLVVTAMIIFLGIFDLVMVVRGKGVSTSVSRFLQRVGFKSPVFVFGVAFVCGHLFGYLAPECPVLEAPKGCKMIFVDERTSAECESKPLEKFEELKK